MDFIAWMHETSRLAGDEVEATLRAAQIGDISACAVHAKPAATIFLRRYLEAVGAGRSGQDVVSLLEAAARPAHAWHAQRAIALVTTPEEITQ